MFGKLSYLPLSGSRAVEHLVSQRLTYVGRDKDCAIRFEDSSVDGKQFVIIINDKEAKIQNLSRKLSTQVNQKNIGLREDRELRDQDTISFGNKQFLWTMSSSSGRKNPARHDCLKRTRVSEPVRKVAVVTPNRRETPFGEDCNLEEVPMPPEKRRRTMFDPSAATPESSFARRVKYDRQIKQKFTPNRRKQSVGRTTPAPNSSKKKNLSFSQPLESPQLTYNHETAFNKSITPGRFYRRNDGPLVFRGFNPVPEEPMSPGFLSGCDSFLSMEDSPMSRRSSARVSTPYPNKSLRGSQSSKTPQNGRQSGMYFQTIQEEVAHRSHDATPSSYFSSTSGSPRMMRAESPTILPGGSGSFQGRRSVVHPSCSSPFRTPQERSLHSRNDSMYANASGSSQMRMQDFEGSSLNQSRYSWTTEGISSPRTPPHMRTPRKTRGPVESPGSAKFSPNSEASPSGYVLLSPRGRSIINRAFNRNDLSLQLSPRHSPSRRLFNFSSRTPDNRVLQSAQPLSVQVLTKSLKKKLDSSLHVVSSARSSGRGSLTKNPVVKTPATEPVLNVTPKSGRSSGWKRATPGHSSDPNLCSNVVGSIASPVVASTRSSMKDEKGTRQPKLSKRSLGTPRQSSEPDLSRLSRKSSDLRQSVSSINMRSEPKRSKKESVTSSSPTEIPAKTPGSSGKGRTSQKFDASAKTPTESVPIGTPKSARSTGKRSSVRQSREHDLSTVSRRISVKVDENTPQRKLSRRSLGATPQRSSEPDLSTLSRKSNRSIPPIELPYSEPKRSMKDVENFSPFRTGVSVHVDAFTAESMEVSLRSSLKSSTKTPVNGRTSQNSSALLKTPTTAEPVQNSPKSTGSKQATLRQSSEPDLFRGRDTPSTPQPKHSLRSTPRQSSEPNLARLSRKSSDVRQNTPLVVLKTRPRSSKKDSKTSTPSKSPGRADQSPGKVTPLNTSVEVNMRSSRKMSTKKKDTPSTPLTTSPHSSPPASLPKSARKSVTLVKKLGQASSSSVESTTSSMRSLVSPVGHVAHSASPGSPQKTQSPNKTVVPDIIVMPPTPPVVSRRLSSRSSSTGKKASVNLETPGSRQSNRRSRASLVGGAAQFLHLPSPGSSKKRRTNDFSSETKVSRSSGENPSSEERRVSSGRRSLNSGIPRVVSVHQGIRNEEIPETCRSPEKSPTRTSNRSSHRSSADGRGASDVVFPSTSQSKPPRASRSSTESALVTPPRSVEPAVNMRSSRKTPRPATPGTVPSTPTSVLRRSSRRSCKRSSVPSIRKKLIVLSPRKDSTVKKLTLDPEKPDKNKIAALIACHKKKSPTKEHRSSSSGEKTSSGKSTPEKLTPLKDLDIQPEERSPEDALLDALDLSRKSAIVAEPKRPSRRLRSSTNQLSAKGVPGSSKTPTSPPKSVKKLLFKSPLVEYEGSHVREERSPSRSLKGILMPSPTTTSEEPMSCVLTTSPVVDFTDASGRKKIFRVSPNSKSKAGGIRELVPDYDSDLNIWTLFEDSSGGSESSRKRRGSEPSDSSPSKKAKTPHNDELASPPQSRRRKRAAENNSAISSSKVSRKRAKDSVKNPLPVKSAEKPATSRSTRRNLNMQFDSGAESPKPSTSQSSPKVASPKQLRRAKPVSKRTTKTAATPPKARKAKAQKPSTPAKSPAKTRSKAAAKSSKKSQPKPPPRAGKAGTSNPPPKTLASKAKPKKVAQPANNKKAARGEVRKSPSRTKSPVKPRRGAVAKSTKQAVKASKTPPKAAISPAKSRRGADVSSKKGVKVQPKAVGRKTAVSSPVKSPPKSRKAVAKSTQKPAQKVTPKARKSPEKSPAKTASSKAKSQPKGASSKAKSPSKAASGKAKPTKSSVPSPALKVSPKKTRANQKAASVQLALAKPKATTAKTKSVNTAKPRLSVAPKPLKGKAIGSKVAKKSASPKASPAKTRSRKPAATSTAKSSRGKR